MLRLILKYYPGYRRLFPAIADNLLVYSLKKIPAKGPCYVNFGISGECNLRCAYCLRWEGPLQKKSVCLTTSQKLEIIDQLAACGVYFLSLYDREPLLAPDLKDIIVRAKTHGLVVNLSTNGLLLEESAGMLVDAGVDSLIISVESAESGVHDFIRGYPGLFRKIEAGIFALRRLRKSRNRPRINIRILINRQTYQGLSEYVRYWKDKADGIIMKPIDENDCIGYLIPDRMRFSAEDRQGFETYFGAFLRKNRALDNAYTRRISEYIFNRKELSGKYSCFAGSLFGTIDINGDVYFCAEHKHKIGNLQNSSFMTIWGDREAMFERSRMRRSQVCFCWLELFLFNIYLTRLLGKPR